MYKFYVNRVNESLLDDLKVNREIVERTKRQAQRYEEVKGEEQILTDNQLDEFNKILLSFSSTLDDYVNKLEGNTETMKSAGLYIYRYNLLATVLNKFNLNTLGKTYKDKLISKLEELEPKTEELYRYAVINDFTDLDSIKLIVDNFKSKNFRVVPVGAVKMKSISDVPVDIFGQIKEIERDNQILLEKAHLLTYKEQRNTQLFIDKVRLLERKIKSGNSNQKDLDDFKGLLLTFKSIIEGLEDRQYTYDNYIHSLDVLGTAPSQKLKRELNIQSNWDNTKLHNDIEKLINPPELTRAQIRKGMVEPVRVPPLERVKPVPIVKELPKGSKERYSVFEDIQPFQYYNELGNIDVERGFDELARESVRKPRYLTQSLTVNDTQYKPEGALGTPEDTKKMGSLSRDFQGEEGDDRFLEEVENRVGDPRGSLPLDYRQPRYQPRQSLLTADDEDTQRYVPKIVMPQKRKEPTLEQPKEDTKENLLKYIESKHKELGDKYRIDYAGKMFLRTHPEATFDDIREYLSKYIKTFEDNQRAKASAKAILEEKPKPTRPPPPTPTALTKMEEKGLTAEEQRLKQAVINHYTDSKAYSRYKFNDDFKMTPFSAKGLLENKGVQFPNFK